MATITAALFQALVGFDIGTDTYTAAVSKAQFVPQRATSQFTDITGAITSLAGKSGYNLQLELGQDWDTDGSLSHHLFDNDGEQITVKVHVPGGYWQATVIAGAPDIGGGGASPATSSLTLPVVGLPVWHAAV